MNHSSDSQSQSKISHAVVDLKPVVLKLGIFKIPKEPVKMDIILKAMIQHHHSGR